MGEVLIADVETSGLLDLGDALRLHMIQLGTLDGDDATLYLADHVDPDEIAAAYAQGMTADIRPLKEGVERLRAAEMSYWHNGTAFDQHAINQFYPGTWTREKTRDTLVMARLAWPMERDHSLAAWGRRMEVLKGDFRGPWDVVTADMLTYSAQDIVVGRAITRKALAELAGQERALETEHAVAYWINAQERNGFHLDVKEAERLYVDLLARKRELERDLKAVFPSRWVSAGRVIPKASNSKFGVTRGQEYTRVLFEEFSASSRQMIGRRLVEKGWKPAETTPTGQPVIDEETLSALAGRFPEAAKLAEYLDTEKQAAAVGGKGGWLSVVKPDGRVHGRVNTIGAYTQRMAHSKPNMTTVPKEGGYRALWLPRPGWKLVGVDGEGIQARVVGHYLVHWDKGAFGDRCVNGNSDLGTDIHSANRDAILHCYPADMPKDKTRSPTKNVLYAIFFGAQDPRLALTLKEGCLKAKVKPPRVPNRELGAAIRRGLEKTMTGLTKLQELCEKTFEQRKFLVGLDGRKLRPPSKRTVFVTLVQAGEATIMKHALVIFADEFMPADNLEWDRDWAFCANVHDEVQIECRPEIAEHVGARFAEAIRVAGERLDMKCQQQGKASIGNTWAETH